jgi:uncharacterized protein YndB with AHSA1/START domain
MADLFHLIQVDGTTADAAYTALTTQDGITGWWTSRAEVSADQLSMRFPDAPMTWDMNVVKADRPAQVDWKCFGGPPAWIGTHVTWAIEPTDAGVTVRLDHTGFAAVDDMFRIVTGGWAHLLTSLKAYLETGRRKPFFTF